MSRSRAARHSSYKHGCRAGFPARSAATIRRPCRAKGGNRCAGSSALMRNSMAQRPFGGAGCLKDSGSPDGDAQLLGHQIDAEDLFGHRMLDLDARVHLDEEPAPAVEIVDELDGAGAFIFDVADERDRGFRHLRRALRGRALAMAPPRPASGAGAGCCNRAPTDGSHCRGCRQTPESRCGAPARKTAPDRSPDCRMPPAASAEACANSAAKIRRVAQTMRMPRPPPPPEAFSSSGKPMSLASSQRRLAASVKPCGEPGTTGTPLRSAVRRASTLSPISANGFGAGPDER